MRVELVLALPPLVSLAGLVRSLEHLGLRLTVYSFQTGRAGLVVFLVQLELQFRGDVLPLMAGRVILVVCLEQLRFLQRLFPVKQLRQQFTAFLPSGKVRLASGLSCNSAWVDFCPSSSGRKRSYPISLAVCRDTRASISPSFELQ